MTTLSLKLNQRKSATLNPILSLLTLLTLLTVLTLLTLIVTV